MDARQEVPRTEQNNGNGYQRQYRQFALAINNPASAFIVML